MNRPTAKREVSNTKSPSPSGRGLGGGGFGWLGAGIILGTAILAAAAPTPAHAMVDCCCDQGRTRCIERLGNADCHNHHPDTPYNVIDTNKTSCAELQSTVQIQDQPAQPTQTRPSWVPSILGNNQELIPDECRTGPQTKDKPCTLTHLLQVVVNVTRLMLGLMGSIALLMFVYGGFVFITAAGNAERVGRGKTVLTNAVFGILILLVSWSAVNFLVVVLSQGRGGLGDIGEIFSKPWNKGP